MGYVPWKITPDKSSDVSAALNEVCASACSEIPLVQGAWKCVLETS